MKKLNSKLLLKKKTISNLNDKLSGGNAESVTVFTIFLSKYCGTANCSALCGETTLCQTDKTCWYCDTDLCA